MTSDRKEQLITLTFQHTLTRVLTSVQYDAIICGTGYERLVWLRLLRSSNLAKRFGFDCTQHGCSNGPVRLIAEDTQQSMQTIHPESADDSDVEGSQSLTNSCFSSTDASSDTPPSSPDLEVFPPTVPMLRITRNYQILPSAFDTAQPLKGRIYLQGYAEATHGLSDTLLSVVSIRAGEIVDDIWNTERD